jgi:NDP-sugar pyrophosphorylase family protein
VKRPIPALVLTAGLGTRLYPLTEARAKPAAPVAGVPLVLRILRRLAEQGVEEAVLNLHHLPHTIASVVGDGTGTGLRVRYVWEHPRLLGSAGGPRHMLSILPEGPVLIVNGDTLTDVSVAGLVAAHEAMAAQVTLAVTPNAAPDRYRGVLVDADRRVTGFAGQGDRQPSWHLVGLQVVEAGVLTALADGTYAETTRGLYPAMIAAQPGSVRAWCTEGTFVDIGTPADYLAANLMLARREDAGRLLVGERGSIAASARLEDTVLWDDVSVGADAELERCVVADGVRIPAGAHYVECALARRRPSGLGAPPDAGAGNDLLVAPLGRLPAAWSL